MIKKSRSRLQALALACLACGLSACGGSTVESGGGGPRAGGTLVVGTKTEPDALNIYLAGSSSSLLFANRVLPRLFEERMPYGQAEAGYEPELTESWATSDDGMSLTLTLREGGRWTDGGQVACEDVVFTYRAQTDPALGWRAASIKRHIDSITCEDERTAVFRFKKAYPGMLMDANDLHILPASLASIPFESWRETDWSSQLPWGGPFRLSTWRPGQELVLERHDGWFGPAGQPYLDRIIMRVVPDQTARVTQLLAGDLDLVPNLSPEDAARVARTPGKRVLRRPGPSYVYLGWNTVDPEAWRTYRASRDAECRRSGDDACADTADDVVKLARRNPHPLFGDARVRRAMTMAIDRETLIDTLLLGEGVVPASPILAPLPEHDPQLDPWPHDPAAARALLAEAGFGDEDGDGTLERQGVPLAFELFVQAGAKLRRDTAVLIQRDLAAVGAAVTITPIENNSFYTTLMQRGMDAWIGAWLTSLRVDMTEMLHADAAASGGANFGAFSDDEADELASAAREVVDDDQRAAAWHAWERRFHELQPYSVLFHPNRLMGVSERVRGTDSILPNDDLAGVESWWLAAAEQ